MLIINHDIYVDKIETFIKNAGPLMWDKIKNTHEYLSFHLHFDIPNIHTAYFCLLTHISYCDFGFYWVIIFIFL